MKYKNIVFINTVDKELQYPLPASKYLPEWYKDHNSYINGKKGLYEKNKPSDSNSTIKKCMPVFDVLTSGYIITSAVDIYVSQETVGDITLPKFNYPSLDYVQSHTGVQAKVKREDFNDYFVPKINNIWAIKTPPGYSCLFMPPVHRDNIIEILPGVVDTDRYNAAVSFPFILRNNFEGLIEAGTPIAQVVPFKRDSWKSNISYDLSLVNKSVVNLFTVFYDGYKKIFWQKKQYL